MLFDPNTGATASVTFQKLAVKKTLTLLAIQTTNTITTEQNAAMARKLKAFFGVESLRIVFEAEIPELGNEFGDDLHLTTQLRAERKQVTETEQPPITEAAGTEPAPEAAPVEETAVTEPVVVESTVVEANTVATAHGEHVEPVAEATSELVAAPPTPVPGAPTPSVDPA